MKKTFMLLFSFVIVVSGCFVNPISRGASPFFEKKLTQKIMDIEESDPHKLWAGERYLYGALPGLGVRTFNAVAFTPDVKSWRALDPDGESEEIYNRFAHISLNIANEEKSSFQLNTPDSFTVNLNPQGIKEYQIDYIVAVKDLEGMDTSEMSFERLYGPDADGYRIYKVVYIQNQVADAS